MRFTFPQYEADKPHDQSRRVFVRLPDNLNSQGTDAAVFDATRNAIIGKTTSNSGGLPENRSEYGMYIHVESDQEVMSVNQVVSCPWCVCLF
jgi:hypothetical protein